MKRKVFGVRGLLLAAPVLAAAIAAVVMLAVGGSDARERPIAEDAFATATAAGPGAAAVVNGVSIPVSRVKLAQAFSQVTGGPAEASLGTGAGALEQAVANELLYQEAVRRGLEPSAADVSKVVAEQKAALERLLADPSADPAVKQMLVSLKGTGFDIASYDTNADVSAVFRRSLAVAALRQQIRASLPGDQQTLEGVNAAVARLIDSLRSKGNVQVLIADP